MKSLPTLRALWRLLLTQSYWRLRLGALGRRSIIYKPLMLVGARHISMGSNSSIREMARLEALVRTDVGWRPALTIGRCVNIEQGVHIVCQCEVSIGDNVSITPFCTIVDTYHPHDPPDTLPKIGARLPLVQTHVRIGAGTFVGAHSVILANVTIGRGCVIGAGSVVSRDVPDYVVVAGTPARILKIFDPQTRTWTPA